MILLGLGSNLVGHWGAPAAVLDHALHRLEAQGVIVLKRSNWVGSTPLGPQNQPDFLNGVIQVKTSKPPESLLSLCHKIEVQAGRKRGLNWGPRVLDIDLLAYHNVICGNVTARGSRRPLILPHPELELREFVLQPLAEIAPYWHHPISGKTVRQMLRALKGSKGGRVL